MKLLKEMFFKLLLFSIFSLIYYIFMINSFFNDGIFGFICFGITYILVEIIYKVLNEKTKFFTKRISMIILIVIASIMYLSMAMGIIDYSRATNGEEPIFTWKSTPEYAMFITYTDEGDMNEDKGIAFTEYKGLGYKIVVCSEKVTCENRVAVLPFGLGAFSYSYTGRSLTKFD